MIKSTAGILQTQTSPADNRTRKKEKYFCSRKHHKFLKKFLLSLFLFFLYPKIVTKNYNRVEICRDGKHQ